MARILLVEPDRILARHIAAVFNKTGHEVICALGGQEAIQAADELRPDIVVLELQLKGHNGVEFLYEFRSYTDWQHIPVIVHSLVPPHTLKGIETVPLLRVSKYLYKPKTTLDQLAEAVDELIAVPV